MSSLLEYIRLIETPQFTRARMVMGFSGWMDGGNVSTGSIEYLADEIGTRRLAEIRPDQFYMYHLPGPADMPSIFRPHAEISNGLVVDFDEPFCRFFYNELNDLILFAGKEPQLCWNTFANVIFDFAKRFNVDEIFVIGSFAGMVPHSREPRIFASMSQPHLRDRLSECNVTFSDYQGPAGIATFLTKAAGQKNIDLTCLVAELPPYVQGHNPKCIESVLKRIAKLLNLNLNLEKLRLISEELEQKLDNALEDREDLAEQIKKLEENYDQEIFDHNMGDLKNWLETKGIRLD